MVQKITVEKFACSHCGQSYETCELALNCELACFDEQNASTLKTKLINAISLSMKVAHNRLQLEQMLNEVLSSFFGKASLIRILEFNIQSASVNVRCEIVIDSSNYAIFVDALRECGWFKVTSDTSHTRVSARISLEALPTLSKHFEEWLERAKTISKQAEEARDNARHHLKTTVLASVLEERATLRDRLAILDEQIQKVVEVENKKLGETYQILPFEIQHNVFFFFPKTISKHDFD